MSISGAFPMSATAAGNLARRFFVNVMRSSPRSESPGTPAFSLFSASMSTPLIEARSFAMPSMSPASISPLLIACRTALSRVT